MEIRAHWRRWFTWYHRLSPVYTITVSYGSFFLRLACAVLPIAAWGQQYTINTVAGNQSLGAGYGGDNQAATADQLNGPLAIAFDSQGNYYIADSLNHRIRKVSGGNITTVAGNGTEGYSGDGGAATSAELDTPSGIAIDSAGNIYISDTKNNVIRRVTTDGKIATWAGNQGLGAGYGGDNAAPNSAGAQFSGPLGLAFDPSGNLYIADAGNSLVRKINSAGTLLTTAVGEHGTIGILSNPVALCVDPAGKNLYIADTGNKDIERFQFSNAQLSNFIGSGASGYTPDGPVTLQGAGITLNDAAGVAADAAGNVYLSDTVNSLIRVVTANNVLSTIAGRVLAGGRPIPGYSGDGGPATSAQLFSPKGLAIDKSGNIYVADTGNNVIRTLAPTYPAISSGGIGNAFSYNTQISPGAAAVIYGTGFGGATVTPAISQNKFPTTAGGVGVTVNGVSAALYYVSPNQIDFQVPWETGLGTASVVVSVNGGPSNTASVQVVAAGPGLYSTVENYPDYSFNTAQNPVAAGGIIFAYATGSGPVSSPQTDGVLAPSSPLATASGCTATIGSASANVTFCGLVANSLGLLQMNITVPSGLATGSYPLTVSINGQNSNTVNINVK